MLIADLLETMMVICFSTGWYWSIRQVWISHDSRGMSKTLPAVVAIGCLFGVAAKLALYAATGFFSLLVLIYAWNVILSLAQLFLIVKFSEEFDGRRFIGVDPADLESARA